MKLAPREFWDIIDKIYQGVVDWVLENGKDVEYQICGKASDILYAILYKWRIHERCGEDDIDYVMRIIQSKVCGIWHDWVEVLGYVYDPTYMQFDDPPRPDDYYSFDKVEIEYLFHDCQKFLENHTYDVIVDEILSNIGLEV